MFCFLGVPGIDTQPPTVVCKMEAQSEYVQYTSTHCIHTFENFGTDIYAQSRLSIQKLTKFLHGKFIVVAFVCWLGMRSWVSH